MLVRLASVILSARKCSDEQIKQNENDDDRLALCL